MDSDLFGLKSFAIFGPHIALTVESRLVPLSASADTSTKEVSTQAEPSVDPTIDPLVLHLILIMRQTDLHLLLNAPFKRLFCLFEITMAITHLPLRILPYRKTDFPSQDLPITAHSPLQTPQSTPPLSGGLAPIPSPKSAAICKTLLHSSIETTSSKSVSGALRTLIPFTGFLLLTVIRSSGARVDNASQYFHIQTCAGAKTHCFSGAKHAQARDIIVNLLRSEAGAQRALVEKYSAHE